MIPVSLAAKYEILGDLGAGGMGIVLDARDRNLDRRVAIKLIRRQTGDGTAANEAHARFRREAREAGRLIHANIVAVHDFGEDGDAAWIVMEYVPGGSLKALLENGGRVKPFLAVRMIGQVLEAVHYSHSMGVVHRDIKPANLLLGGDGQVKLADFGIAHVESSTLTQVGTVLGTPGYMAPEQIRGEPVDGRADLWAIGVVLYELLTGERPFEGSNFTMLSHRILTAVPVLPSQVSSLVPLGLDAVVAKALAKRPDDRFQTARAFAAALDEAMTPDDPTRNLRNTGPPKPSTGKAASRPVRWPLLAGLGGAGVVAAGLAIWLLLPGGEAPVRSTARDAAPTQPAPPPPEIPPGGSPGIVGSAPIVAGPDPDPPTAPRPTPGPPIAIPPHVPAPPPPLPVPVLDEITPPPAPPPAPAPLTLAEMRAIAREAAAGIACSLLAVQPSPVEAVRITGIATPDAVMALRTRLLDHRLPAAVLRLDITTVDPPYCPVLDVLRTISGSELSLDLVDRGPLRKGSLLRVDVGMPSWRAQLVVHYLSSDGQAAVLDWVGPQAPAAQLRLGEPRGRFPGWRVSEPFGRDLFVVVASDGPLFAQPRPAAGPIERYAADLAAALQTARREGRRVSSRVLVVETIPR